MRTYSYRFQLHLSGGDTCTGTITEVIHVNGTKMSGKIIRSKHLTRGHWWEEACQMAAATIQAALEQDRRLNPGRPFQAELPLADAYDGQRESAADGTPPPEQPTIC